MKKSSSKDFRILSKKTYITIITTLFIAIIVGTIGSTYAANDSYERIELENRIVSTALTFFYNSEYSDYDQKQMYKYKENGDERSTNIYYTSSAKTNVSFAYKSGYILASQPKNFYSFRNKDQDPDNTSRITPYFIDCSSFTRAVYYYGMNFDIFDKLGGTNTEKFTAFAKSKVKSGSPNDDTTYSINQYPKRITSKYLVYYRHITSFSNKSKASIVSEMKDILRPGDLIVRRKSSSGHIVLYVGGKIVSGDTAIMHSTGQDMFRLNNYENNTGKDVRALHYTKKFDYLIETGSTVMIFRPINEFYNSDSDKNGVLTSYASSDNATITNDTTAAALKKATNRFYFQNIKREQYATDAGSKPLTKYNSINSGENIVYNLSLSAIGTSSSKLSYDQYEGNTDPEACNYNSTSHSKYYTKSACKTYSTAVTIGSGTKVVVKITAKVPSGSSYVSCTGGCTVSGDTVTWTSTKNSSGNYSGLFGNYSYTVKATTASGTVSNEGFTLIAGKDTTSYTSNPLTLGAMNVTVGPNTRRTVDKTILYNAVRNNMSITHGSSYKICGDSSAVAVNGPKFIRKVYCDAYGLDLGSDFGGTLVKNNFFSPVSGYEFDYSFSSSIAPNSNLTKMYVPGLYGGSALTNEGNIIRIRYMTEANFEVGDVIVSYKLTSDKEYNMYFHMYMGNHQFVNLYGSGTNPTITNNEYDATNNSGDKTISSLNNTNYTAWDSKDYFVRELYNKQLFVVLRPSRIMTYVSYNLNGGSGTAPESFLAYGTYKNLTTTVPTRSGYIFDGWYTAATGGTKVTSSTAVSSSILYAHWIRPITPPTTSMCSNPTYSGNLQSIVKSAGAGYTWSGGNNQLNVGSYTVYATLQSGYAWLKGSTPYYASETITCSIAKRTLSVIAKNQTINVGAQINKGVNYVTVSGLANGQSLSAITLNQSTTAVTTTGTIIPSGAVVKDSSGNITTGNYNISYTNGSLTIKSLVKYMVTFNSNGGSSVAKQEVTGGEKVSQPTAPTRAGYAFGGWFSDSTLQNEYDFNTPVTKDITLYARWEASKYQVAFNTDGGSNVASQNIEYGGKVTKPGNPTKNGYRFAGWYTSSSYTTEYDFNSKVTKALIIYAKWIPVDYRITYYLNGGVATNPGSYTINTSTFTLNRPTKSGATFKGWTGSNGTNPELDVTIPIGTTGDKSYTANYDAVKYTVTFNSNGGSSVPLQEVVTGKKVIEPVTPEREGYAFDGWYSNSELTTKYNFNNTVTSNFTLYAKWVTGKYQITYNLNGGVADNPTSYGIETETFILSEPTKEGAVFIGWTGSNGTTPEKNVTITQGTTGNLNYTANYDQTSYKITFNYEGLDEISFDYGEQLTLPMPTKTGYRFIGWYKDSSFNEVFNETVMPAEDITLYPKFEINTYKLIFRTNGGNAISALDITYNDDIVSLPTPVKEGYRFIGWYTDEALTTMFNASKMPASNMVLYAAWEGDTYTVHFETSGGTVINNAIVLKNETLVKPSDPTKSGYIFGDWYSDSNLTRLYDFNNPVTADMTLYAKWEVRNYRIDYILDGGVVENKTSYNIETETFTLNNPTKEGYTFSGWTGSNGTVPSKNVTVERGSVGNKIYTANYEVNSYTISFNSNGGSSVSDITKAYGEIVDAPTNPTKAGYKFAGWYRDNEFTRLYTFTIMPSENITLYAKWTTDNYIISYVVDGGENNETNPTSYNGGEEKELKSPTRVGYNFLGWYSDEEFTNRIDVIAPDMNRDLILYAKWDAIKYQIMFETNGGNPISNMEKEYKNSINLPTPTKEGYRFAGWYKNAELTELFTSEEMPAENITLYARWEINNYTISFDSNGGNNINPITAEYDSIIKEPNKPFRNGYKFAGWYSDKELTKLYSFDRMGSKNIMLYAKWIANGNNTIKYVLNGGVNSTKNKTSYAYGKEIKLYNPTRKGYEFAGWYLEKDYQTRIYKISKNMSTDLTLYAKWTKLNEIDVPDTGSNTSILPILGGIILITIGGYFALNRKQENHK